jgi:hypothetical protein
MCLPCGRPAPHLCLRSCTETTRSRAQSGCPTGSWDCWTRTGHLLNATERVQHEVRTCPGDPWCGHSRWWRRTATVAPWLRSRATGPPPCQAGPREHYRDVVLCLPRVLAGRPLAEAAVVPAWQGGDCRDRDIEGGSHDGDDESAFGPVSPARCQSRQWSDRRPRNQMRPAHGRVALAAEHRVFRQ